MAAGHVQVQPFLEDEALVVGAPALFAQRPVAQPSTVGHVPLLSKSRSKDSSWKKLVNAPRCSHASCLLGRLTTCTLCCRPPWTGWVLRWPRCR